MIIVNKLDVTQCPDVREGMIYAICVKHRKLCLEVTNCPYKEKVLKNENNSRNTKI